MAVLGVASQQVKAALSADTLLAHALGQYVCC
jgi:hypothetical protein